MTQKLSNKSRFLNTEEIKKYIVESVRIAWKMAIQRPAMTFSTGGEGEKWDEATQDLCWNSNDPTKKGAVVKYYVHPALKHRDTLMVKGKVMVK